MSIRDDITIDWQSSPRILEVAAPSVEVSIQDLFDTCKYFEDNSSSEGLTHDFLISAGGKEFLGGTTYVGVTATLNNAVVRFEARSGPDWILCKIAGGNLVAVDDLGAIIDPRLPSAYTSCDRTASASATLQEQEAIQDMAFFGAVWYDSEEANGAGVDWPLGTQAYPSGVYADARSIDAEKNFRRYQILHSMTMIDADTYDNYTFIGAGQDITKIIIPDAAILTDCSFIQAEVEGILEGKSRAEKCLFKDISGLQGKFYDSILGPGTVVLSDVGVADFIDCNSGVPGLSTPIIDYNLTGSSSFRGFKGGTLHTNKTGSESVSIDLVSGQVKLDIDGNFGANGLENGQFVVRGVGKVIDATSGEHLLSGSYGSLTLVNETVAEETVAQSVWQRALETGFTMEEAFRVMTAAMAGLLSGAGGTTITIRNLADTVDRIVATVDEDGNRTAVNLNVS